MAQTEGSTELVFLSGIGECAELIRSVDWTTTPLGPAAGWPQSLKTTTSIMLESRFGTYIAWGPHFIQLYNDGYRPILGSTKHPAVGKSARETFAESWHIIGPLFERVMRGEAVGSEDWMLPLDRHGYLEECYFTYCYSPVRDESGGVGGVLVTVTETTGRVIADRRLRTLRDLAAGAASVESESQAWSRASRPLAANPSDLPWATLYAIDEPGGRARRAGHCGAACDSVVAPDAVDLTSEAGVLPLRHAVESGRIATMTGIRERAGDIVGAAWPEPVETAVLVPVRSPDASRPYGVLVAGISPRRAFDDDYRDFLVLAADHIATAVTNARARAQEQQRAEALAALDRAKTAFFSNVSHEFRTPLTLMIGPTEDALAGARRALAGDDLEIVYRNELRLLKLVNTLLEFSRIEAGRVDAVYEPADLAALTRDLASTFRSAVERGGLRLEIDCPPLSEPVHVDRQMWEKIVLNLLSNALKFTFDGSIVVRLVERDDRVELVVRDTGVGIPEAELPRLFERFHRIEGTRARTHEGSGIGLALVRDLVGLHGGRISARSRMGEGTTFTVELLKGSAHLPADRLGSERQLASTAIGADAFVAEALRWLPDSGRDAGAGAAPGETGQARDGVHAGALPARILVADDNADMREYLARLLGRRWAVDVAADGEAALAAVRASRPDLVLADVMMPRLSGFDLLREVRANQDTATVPVILLSARAGEESRVEGLEAGADDYLAKPFSARELLARVGTQLELHRLRRAAEADHAKLNALFEQAPAAIALFSGPAHEMVFVNDQYCAISGRTRRDLVGRRFVDAFPELAASPAFDVLDRVYTTGVPAHNPEFAVTWDRNQDGTRVTRFFDWTCQPLRDPRGGLDGTAHFFFDVSDRVRDRAELDGARTLAEGERAAAEHARALAESASRAKDEFLAMLGHELRNPLAPIVTALQLLQLRGVDTSPREFGIIDRQVKQLIGLVDDLLDVSRIRQGKIALKSELVEIADVVATAIETTSPLIDQRRHSLELSVARGGQWRVQGDAARLAQAVGNLVANAAKYTEPEGRIVVGATRKGPDILLSIRDNGIGISAEMLPRVFDLFAQERQHVDRSQGGLGLGLAIVRSLVELHGGSVEARSDGPGRGSEFVVRLPAASKAHAAPAGTRAPF